MKQRRFSLKVRGRILYSQSCDAAPGRQAVAWDLRKTEAG